MRKRYLLLLLTLIFGLALIAVDRYTQELNQPLSEQQSNEADYYGETLLNWHYGVDGKLGQTFRAQRSDHYPLIGVTRFFAPMITTRDDRGQIWQVTAKEGSLKDDEQVIRFNQAVRIEPINTGEQTTDAMLIETEALTYDIREQIAATDLLVTMTGPGSRATATGMTLDVNRQRMELKTGVKTIYVPEQ
ncbi:LPS export ABC transporter periplasmic protein LptC [Thalassolituus sp.]|jgi:lipopolysaccharide export system protein LptC|uniref:LPS export ABC transporter periplasmic protein LptC n=1 Tax=Thalassolituus sp. TaxID=2030822 RepID=UPI002A839703|nr:LPS export ABC transporter periplasmic protein LptC [Thalassolituus sp.]